MSIGADIPLRRPHSYSIACQPICPSILIPSGAPLGAIWVPHHLEEAGSLSSPHLCPRMPTEGPGHQEVSKSKVIDSQPFLNLPCSWFV